MWRSFAVIANFMFSIATGTSRLSRNSLSKHDLQVSDLIRGCVVRTRTVVIVLRGLLKSHHRHHDLALHPSFRVSLQANPAVRSPTRHDRALLQGSWLTCAQTHTVAGHCRTTCGEDPKHPMTPTPKPQLGTPKPARYKCKAFLPQARSPKKILR